MLRQPDAPVMQGYATDSIDVRGTAVKGVRKSVKGQSGFANLAMLGLQSKVCKQALCHVNYVEQRIHFNCTLFLPPAEREAQRRRVPLAAPFTATHPLLLALSLSLSLIGHEQCVKIAYAINCK